LKVYWRAANGTRTGITLGELIGSGKEGDVYRLAAEPTLCAKIYREPPPDVREHVRVLVEISAQGWYQRKEKHVEVAWPVGACEDATGSPIGFFMNALTDLYFPARDAFSAPKRKRIPSLTWGCQVALAADLARMVGKLHAKGMLVGDLALPNLAVSDIGRVQLLDSDSFAAKSGGRVYGGSTWRPENGPPEGGPRKHTKETDYFALAIVICQLLLEEYHPFGGTDTTSSSDYEPSEAANIERGRSWLFHGDIRVNKACPPPNLLPGYLLDLAHNAFERGIADPQARPTARDWYEGLLWLGESLQACGYATQHVYNVDEWDDCPWCQRVDQLGDEYDAFPCRSLAPIMPGWLAAKYSLPVRFDELGRYEYSKDSASDSGEWLPLYEQVRGTRNRDRLSVARSVGGIDQDNSSRRNGHSHPVASLSVWHRHRRPFARAGQRTGSDRRCRTAAGTSAKIFTIFEGASELQQVITGSDIRYPVRSGYRYYQGALSKTGRPAGKRLLRRIEWKVRVPALRATEPETGEEGRR
jgi:serine/threonine protein kinase